ncbi:hypothetical protein LR948_09190 [Roseivivax sp. GX 12232]|uniref:hypothetical protein n=1 Tax=Roseivivax sp. GX 12232 TaxID=2900547 RepID=UPI001E4B3563|nr:hypothetical protein [Roseivivax sp. GX 12232]MCE0505526.1 hypothetical protein [Roseivivax sp. GX 12232]
MIEQHDAFLNARPAIVRLPQPGARLRDGRYQARQDGPRVIRSWITNVHRERDFGRVEAWVTIVVQYAPCLPPRTTRLLVGVPAPTSLRPGELRKKLIVTTLNLATLMHRAERGGRRATA